MQDNSTPAVLIVEDDALVRALAVDIVEGAGYIAIEASAHAPIAGMRSPWAAVGGDPVLRTAE
jgi:CheY-like chemotaxis protein